MFQHATPVIEFLLASIVLPKVVPQLAIFYLFWILAFVGINVVWDIKSTRTPDFHPHKLRGKVGVAHSAAAFSSSLLIIIGVVSPGVAKIAQDTMVPLILAALGGILLSLPAICPYPPPSKVLAAIEAEQTDAAG